MVVVSAIAPVSESFLTTRLEDAVLDDPHPAIVDGISAVEAAAHAQRSDLVRERVVQVVELELVHTGAAAKHNSQDSVDPAGLAINPLREQVVPEVGMIDVRESRPAERPSQAAEEVDDKHHRPAMAVHEGAAHKVNPRPQAERDEHVEK